MNRKRIWVISLMAITLLFGGLLGGVYWYGNQSTIPDGVYLYDWHIGGKQPEELQVEWDQRKRDWPAKKITFQFSSNREAKEYHLTLGQLPLLTNEEEILQHILSIAREPGIFQRAWARWKAREGIHYEWEWTWDEAKLASFIEQEWPEWFQSEPLNAKRIITDQDQVIYEPDQSVYHPDVPQIVERLKLLPDEQLWKEKSFRLELPMKEIKATVTLADLKEEGIERKIAEYTTAYNPKAAGRAHNVEAAAKSLHDTILLPDEIFSYRKLMQATEKEFGFKPAPVIMEGELRPGIGGGVCQVSTTLYNAVLLSDLDVVERRNHSLPIAYVPLGRDATYSDWGIDFRFKNNTGKNLLIRSLFKNGKLTVKIFGTAPQDKEVEIFTKTLKSQYQVAVYKKIRVNGKVVKEELVSKDTYRPNRG